MMLDDVKTSLRIKHDKLDDDIQAFIDAAKAEMLRLGVSSAMVEAEEDVEPLILQAIKTYVKAAYADDPKTKETYQESWIVQVDQLRKSRIYKEPRDV